MTIEAGPDQLYTTRARSADVPALLELINGAYRGAPSRHGWTTEADLVGGPRVDAALLEEILAAPEQVLLVLRAQAGLFACAQLQRLGAGVAGLGLLAVRPALQMNGLGRQMLAAAERYAAEHYGAGVMELAVLAEREELVGWCERRGYRPTGETRPFPEPDGRSTDARRAGLTLLVLRHPLAA
jgi:N-acetylglutamate synthase-like GNAT family acetyltransferase